MFDLFNSLNTNINYFSLVNNDINPEIKMKFM